MTDIGSVLDYSVSSIQNSSFEGFRKVIDVSGDGVSNSITTAAASERAIGLGITVNGLVIFNEEYDLGELADVELINHYKSNVMGGAGAFSASHSWLQAVRTCRNVLPDSDRVMTVSALPASISFCVLTGCI